MQVAITGCYRHLGSAGAPPKGLVRCAPEGWAARAHQLAEDRTRIIASIDLEVSGLVGGQGCAGDLAYAELRAVRDQRRTSVR